MVQNTKETSTEVRRIMVVEDEPMLRRAVAVFLELEGFQVVEAGSGEEAVNLLSHSESQIDLVFTDVRMPGAVDGISLTAWVKQHRPTVPVIIASGEIGKAHLRDGQVPDLPFFSKPYNYDALISRVRFELVHNTPSL